MPLFQRISVICADGHTCSLAVSIVFGLLIHKCKYLAILLIICLCYTYAMCARNMNANINTHVTIILLVCARIVSKR